jgi:hypothetical protein
MIFRTPWGKERDFSIDELIELMRNGKCSASEALFRMNGNESDWSWATPDGPDLYHIINGRRAVGRGANVVAVENCRRFGAIAELVAFHNRSWKEAANAVAKAEEEYNREEKKFNEFLASSDGVEEYLKIEKELDPVDVWRSTTICIAIFENEKWQNIRRKRDTGWKSWYPSTAVLDEMRNRHHVGNCIEVV